MASLEFLGLSIEHERTFLHPARVIVFILIILFSMSIIGWSGEISSPANKKKKLIKTQEIHSKNKATAEQKTKEKPVGSLATGHLETSQEENRFKEAEKLAANVHGTISKQIMNSAIWLDSFFTNERYLAEENNSYISLRYNVLLEDSLGVSNEPRIDARLILPKLQEKAHVVFSVEPEKRLYNSISAIEDVNTSQVTVKEPQTTPVSDKRRFTTALQYFLKSTKDQSFSVRTGLRFSDMEPVIFGAPRYRLLIPLNSWALRFTQEILYRSDTKWNATTKCDLERPLGPLFFRSTIEGGWFEDKPGYFYNINFILFQPLGTQNALTYEWINSFQTEPTGQLKDIVLSVRYRHNIWRNWLYFDVAPQCRFPSDRDHQATPGILFSMEAVFGRVH